MADAVLAVGDPRRVGARNVLVLTGGVGVAFSAFAFVSTQVGAVRVASPWQDDPYDVVVSFTVFFVPAVLSLIAVRVPLCRARLPLPVDRVAGLVRGAALIARLVAATVVADLLATVRREHDDVWDWRTTVLVLAVVAIGTGTVAVWHCSSRLLAAISGGSPSRRPDWADDVAMVLTSVTPGASLIGITNHVVHRRPVVVAVTGSTLAGIAVAGGMAVREQGFSWLTVAEAAAFALVCVTFLAVANASLGLIAADGGSDESPLER